MRILIKFTLKNMKEKKFRLALILISIVLSTALFFASSAVGENVGKMIENQFRSYFGSSDIRITKEGDDFMEQLFYTENFEKYEKDMAYIVGGIYSSAVFKSSRDENINISMIGFSLDDIDEFNPIQFIEHLDTPFGGKQLVITKQFASEHGYKVGDTIKLDMFGNKNYRMTVWGIAAGSGILKPMNNQINMLMSDKLISRMLNMPGKVYMVYMKTNDGTTKQWIEKLRAEFPGYTIEASIPKEELQEALSMITTLFNIMLILVVFISVFIIFTSFKVIMMERLPVIGTFRSVGATKRSTNIILLGESVLYGLVGGLGGLFLGIGILYLMTSVMAYDPWSGTAFDFELTYSPFHVLSSLVMAVGLSLVSSLIPILRVNKISVKDVVLNTIQQVKKSTSKKNYVGLGMLVIFSLLPITPLFKNNLPMNILCMILAIVGMIMIIPLIIKLFIRLFEKFFGYVFGNVGLLAVKNINDNKNVVNNIVLLTIGIASLFMINVISHSAGVDILNYYKDADFDIWSYVDYLDDSNLNRMKLVDGVADVNGVYTAGETDVVGHDTTFNAITGIDPFKYFDFWDFRLIGDKETMVKGLESDRNMIINQTMAKLLKVGVGDKVTLKINDKNRVYTVIGQFESRVNDGKTTFISEKYFKVDFDRLYYNEVYVKTTSDPEVVNEALVKKFDNIGIWSRTKEALMTMDKQSNNQILMLLQGFSILTMVIGVFGVFNNYLVNMMSRKRSLAMFRSVGMSMKAMRKMLFLESFSGGLIGGLSGLVGGLVFIYVVGHVIGSMGVSVTFYIDPLLCIQSVLGGIVVAIIASVSPVLRSSKMKIIEAIKYE